MYLSKAMKHSLLLAIALVLVTGATSGFAQTKFSSIKLTDGTNSATLNPPTSGTGTFTFPSINGAQTVLSSATGQTINGVLNLGTAGSVGGVLNFFNTTNSFTASLKGDNMTADHTLQLPNASGTLALVGDIAAVEGTADRISVTDGVNSRIVDIASTYVGQNSITTLGTITTGTWNGTAIGTQYGGTGLNASTAANGQLLIGNGSGLSLGAITGTTDQITVTNGAGTIGLSLPTNVTVAGTITGGTLASTGAITAVGSVTGAALTTTGAVTANSLIASGTNKFAGTGTAVASSTSTVVTNASVTANSSIVAVMNSGDIIITKVLPAAGSFTINYSAAADGGEKFSWVIIN
jgi:hypothetical protein